MENMEEIYKEHAKTVYGFLFSKVKNPELAEELTQETFYQAIRSIKRYQGKSSVSTWLCGIAKNVWLKSIQQSNRYDRAENIEELEAKGTPPLEDTFFFEWDNLAIMKCLHSLKDPMREVLYLRLIGNLSFRNIGEIVGKTENWARVTFYRGKEKLMEEMKKNEQ